MKCEIYYKFTFEGTFKSFSNFCFIIPYALMLKTWSNFLIVNANWATMWTLIRLLNRFKSKRITKNRWKRTKYLDINWRIDKSVSTGNTGTMDKIHIWISCHQNPAWQRAKTPIYWVDQQLFQREKISRGWNIFWCI